MQHDRKTLSIRPRADLGEVSDAGELLRRAIGLKLCAVATYNKALVKFAPHILYTRHDDPFVDAMVVERDGKPPREAKLGVFKLAGLKDVRLTADPFQPMRQFDAANESYAGTTIQVVEPAAVPASA